MKYNWVINGSLISTFHNSSRHREKTKVKIAITAKSNSQETPKAYYTTLRVRRHDATMARRSGCIPDYEVNFFGQLCKPAIPPSAVTPPKPELQDAINDHVDDTPIPRRATTSVFEPDPITTTFKKYEHLIRGFSDGNVEEHLATIMDVFIEVRRDRMNAAAKQVREQQPAEHDQVEQIDEHGSEHPEHRHIRQQEQHEQQPPVQQENQHHPQRNFKPQPQTKNLLYRAFYPDSSSTFLQGTKDAQQSNSQHRMEAMPCIDSVLERYM